MNRVFVLITVAVLFVACVGIPISCQNGPSGIQEPVRDYRPVMEKTPTVRVLLVNNAREAHIAVYGSYQITGSLTNIIDQGQGLPKSAISINRYGINIGAKQYSNSEIRITSLRDGEIEVNNIRYRGEIKILQQVSNRFSVIEEVKLENFVAGVLGSEMPHSWNDEALRAQAVVIRTYAMYKRKEKRDDIYHLDMLDLAYRGMAGETPRINKLVQDTVGMVMAYNWNIFPAYFHSTCGGHTEDIHQVFGKESIPPLRGVVCKYCANTKYSNWRVEMNKSDIEKRLREANISVSNIQTVNAIDQGTGIHGAIVEIIAADGGREINANDFRLLVGANNLYSTSFSAKSNGRSIAFSGRGYGHGVGLCQYGAQNMALKGFQWTDIVKYYYPEMELLRVY
ncbi:MAG TPA: SpoIID/LytB domain-containing protein [Candidatus Brocadiaceae bacterium]